MSTWVAIIAFSLPDVFRPCAAGNFLQAEADKYITKEDVELTLLSELSRMSTSAKLRSIEEDLRPMFAALPKNRQGNLEQAVVRYALHRFFVQKHGWYMKGLDPVGGAWSSQAPSNIMKDRAPAYIHSFFEQRSHVHGLGLHELAIFAAVLSDLVQKEASGGLHKVYTTLKLPTAGPVPQYWHEQALKSYLMLYFIGAGDLNMTGIEDFKFLEGELLDIYPDWPSTYMWVEDLGHAHKLALQPRTNPFVPQRETFDRSVDFVKELWHQFGSFQDLECKSLKGRLVELEYQGTGRVRLSKFYAGGVNGDWTLSESVEYLRNLGALDETDPNRPSVVIPNYMTSQTNCLSSSGFYSVCCSDECESLLQHLEEQIVAPSAAPARIVELVSAMQSDTVHAPRNLSSTLLARLDEIAQFHAGHVALHGRLFAQWMHHAYPRECPFPHVSGTTSPLSPDEWMQLRGVENVEATIEEMRQYHSRLEQEASETEEAALPWTRIEELIAGDHKSGLGERGWLSSPALRFTMALVGLAAFAVQLVRASKVAACSSAANCEGVFV